MSTHFREIGGSTVAVLIPCFNEARTVGSVIADMHRSLPAATVYVYDNNSTDDTAQVAAAAGAIVRSVPVQGKGNVVRRMFADIEADVYVLIDGDDTYDTGPLREMVDLVTQEGCDLVNGRRIATADMYTHPSHQFGNRALSKLVHWLFGRSDLDMLSGLKVLSRRFVKSFPLFASGFELETEITVHALDLVMPIKSVPVGYRLRPQGSESKLRTYRDGTRILKTIVALVRRERPLAFFGLIAALLLILAIVLGVPIVTEYAHTHKVPRFPTAFLVVGLLVVSALVVFSGLILDTVTRGRKEAKMLRYLSLEGPLETSGRQQSESNASDRPAVAVDSPAFGLPQRRAT